MPKKKGPRPKLSAEEIKKQILKQLDKIDLEQLTNLTGGRQSESDPDSMEWARVVWTVWRR
jgi:hypothetical protein